MNKIVDKRGATERRRHAAGDSFGANYSAFLQFWQDFFASRRIYSISLYNGNLRKHRMSLSADARIDLIVVSRKRSESS